MIKRSYEVFKQNTNQVQLTKSTLWQLSNNNLTIQGCLVKSKDLGESAKITSTLEIYKTTIKQKRTAN